MAYSLAASDAAATVRLATERESMACPAARAARHVLNNKPRRGLQ
jgi:hypothetical protein